MPTISMLMTGRLGNLLFQYAHIRALCERDGYTLMLSHPWVGEQIFDIPKAVIGTKPDVWLGEKMFQSQDSLIYTRQQVRDWLKIKPEIMDRLRPVTRMRKPVTLDVREGDDFKAAGIPRITRQSYIDAARHRGYSPEDFEWEIDTEPTRLITFPGDAGSCGYGVSMVSLPAFYKLMTAKVHFRANSTFSWWAATLGDARVFSPIIKGMPAGGDPQPCERWVEGNWPVMADSRPNTDLHLVETTA